MATFESDSHSNVLTIEMYAQQQNETNSWRVGTTKCRSKENVWQLTFPYLLNPSRSCCSSTLGGRPPTNSFLRLFSFPPVCSHHQTDTHHRLTQPSVIFVLPQTRYISELSANQHITRLSLAHKLSNWNQSKKEQYISSLTLHVACHILTFYLSLTH